jgi:hypothetical protein
MKDYLVDVTIHVEMRAENKAQAENDVGDLVSLIAEQNNQIKDHFAVHEPTCVGGDNEIATEVAKEAGVSYETAEQFLDGIAPATQEKMSVQELVERLESDL